MSQKRIGILTGGGDCPGLNAVIRAVSKVCTKANFQVLGFVDGFEGLFLNDYFMLDDQNVDNILSCGGTILGTSNIGHFDVRPIPNDVVEQCLKVVQSLNLECIVCIGGDGTMSIAYEMSTHGINIVGVPKTIDNDLCSTDQTFGFDSAVHVVTEAVDRLHTTACSHHRAIVVEVMGRNAGWIALASAVSGGAHAVLLPEVDWNWDSFLGTIKKRHEKGRNYSIIIVSEGIKLPETDCQILSDNRLGGVGTYVADKIKTEIGVPCRCVVLGHIQRGGTPSSYDRILATKYGVKAGECAITGDYGKMVSLRGTDIVTVEITAEMGIQKLVDVEHDQLAITAKQLGIKFGNE